MLEPSRLRFAAALSSTLVMAACSTVPTVPQTVRGPVPARVNGPVVGQFVSPRPRSTATQEAGTLGTAAFSAYSNIMQVDSQGADLVELDGELWRTSLFLRYGIDKRSEFEIELPFLWTTGGFLDSFIEGWHGLFGFPNGGREDRPRDDYSMRVEAGGVEAFELDGESFGLCDTPVSWTFRPYEETATRPSFAVRATLELPTGSVGSGRGNGGLDGAIGVIVEKSVGDWTFGAGLDLAEVSTPSGFARAGLDAPDRLQGWLSCELRHDERTSWLAGVRYAPAATTDMDLSEIDSPNVELDLGLAFELTRDVRLLAGFSEDLETGSGSDLTGWIGISAAR